MRDFKFGDIVTVLDEFDGEPGLFLGLESESGFGVVWDMLLSCPMGHQHVVAAPLEDITLTPRKFRLAMARDKHWSLILKIGQDLAAQMGAPDIVVFPGWVTWHKDRQSNGKMV
jgi:hypothetical protein